MTTPDRGVGLPARIVGPSLTAVGLAAWVLSKNCHEEEAAATREPQDVLDTALGSGEVMAAAFQGRPWSAVSLWETAAILLKAESASVGGDPAAAREAARLRTRVIGLRKALEAN